MSIAEKLATIAENEPKVFEAGKQAQYDEFWDTIQNKGARTNYTMAFANLNWTDELFQPKYDLVGSTFYRCFYNSPLTKIEKALDGSSVSTSTGFNAAFYGMSALVSVSKIISRTEAPWDSTFQACSALEEIRFEGTIGQNGFDVHWSTKLSHDSLMSIINVLKDYSEDTSGNSWVVTLGTANLAKLTDEEKAIATQKGWSLA